jgi:class 3 adenylate cyclase
MSPLLDPIHPSSTKPSRQAATKCLPVSLRTLGAEAAPPRRLARSFAFIDLCGFTRHLDDYGDSVALESIRELRAISRRAADRAGVRIAKWLGDGALIVGLSDQPVLECVLAVRESAEPRLPLRVRAGISSGYVLLIDGDDYVGRAINVAARLCAAAPPGHVLVTVNEQASTDGNHRQILVRGISEPVVVHDLESRGAP